ncbi:MAG: ParB N-terminal domain-containing protein [Candidatus Hadarchaeaceae archaeon]
MDFGENLWFKLAAPGLELQLRLEDLGKVRIHEEIIPELLDKLVDEIKSSGKLKDPVIVDSNKLVVLDGMHRVAALKKLGCRYLPACLVDYQNLNVRVGCWYRTVQGEVNEPKFLNLFRLLGLGAEHTPSETASKALEERQASAALLIRDTCYMLKGESGEIRESYALVKRIELALREEGVRMDYENEFDAVRRARSGEVAATLMVPRVRKDEVIEAALSGNVFAHKTTRHVLSARPMHVDVPIEWLKEDRSIEELNRMLIEHLSKRRVKRLPKGTLFEGRKYEGELWIFE